MAASTAVVIAAGVAAVVIIHPFRGSGSSASHGIGATATQTVTVRSLSSQTNVDATLGYAHDYSVVVPSSGGGQSSPSGQGASGTAGQDTGGASSSSGGSAGQGGGTFTWLPAVGRVIHQGHALYAVDGSPVVLLYESTPAYRTLSQGMSGKDVKALNSGLVAMGYATKSELDPKSSYFSAATATALEKLQGKRGMTKTGSLDLGQAVFLPTAARVTNVSATLGAPAQGGTPVLSATSTKRQVTAQLDATQQSDVAKGDRVTITLPNNRTTPGVVTSVGTVATAPSSGSGSGSSGSSDSSSSSGSAGTTATIQVNIKPTDPKATGTLSQAPVQVTITTATVKHALVVPVDALLARAGGGYAVEVVGAKGSRHLVPVSLGIFDDADGLVQVTSSQLSAGERVVVPKI
jgi:HlyD family secretion protein/Putative peptidoglycan binding domain